MVNRLILSNLVARPVRTVLSVTAVAIEVLLIIMVVGLTHGILEEAARRTQGVGAEIMVQPPTTSMFMGFSGAPMPIQIGDRLRQLAGISAVAPVVVQASSDGGLMLMYGIDADSFNAVTGGFRYLDGHGFTSPDDVLVDDVFASSRGLRAGQTITLLNHEFRIAGVVEHGKGSRIFIPIGKLQDLMGSVGKASLFFVKLADPKQVQQVSQEIRGLLPNYQVRDMQEYVSLMVAGNVPGLGTFISVMIGLAVVIGLLVIFITMYSTMVERTREIGILKSLGASRRYIVALVLRETSVLTAFGIVAGIALSYAARAILTAKFPTLAVVITGDWMLRAGLIALVASLVGASYPALQASRRDAIEALAYE